MCNWLSINRKQHARGTSTIALYLAFNVQNTMQGRGLLHSRVSQQMIAVTFLRLQNVNLIHF